MTAHARASAKWHARMHRLLYAKAANDTGIGIVRERWVLRRART
jgi:hypothetical protein